MCSNSRIVRQIQVCGGPPYQLTSKVLNILVISGILEKTSVQNDSTLLWNMITFIDIKHLEYFERMKGHPFLFDSSH